MTLRLRYSGYPTLNLVGRLGITEEAVLEFLEWCEDVVEYSLRKKKSKRRAKANRPTAVHYLWHTPERRIVHENSAIAAGEEDSIG